jgi:hypothetical protein
MTTAYSTNLELALPVQGELSGTWGDTVNNGITQYLDTAIAGSQIISGSQTAVTLTNTNGDASATNIAQAGSGATGTAQYQIIRCTGNPAGLLTITISDTLTAGYSKTFVIINSTSTSQSVKIVGSGPTTGVTVASGAKALVAWNGSDFVEVASSTADGVTTFSAGTTGFTPSTATSGAVTLAGTLGVANGGTGLTTLTANNVLLGNGTSTPLFVAPGTTGNVLTSNGSTWSSTAPAAGTTFSGGTTGFTPSTATSGAVTLAGTLAVANGGTGQTSYTNGQLLIGNTTGNTLTKATLTQGTGITVTNSTGSITVTNAGVTSNVAGTGISVSGATGAVTITNSGVTSLVAGTGITVSGATGAVTVSASSTGGKAANVQTFNSSGTWTKPSGYGASARVQIQIWGGGGSGGSGSSQIGGGGGGAYNERWIALSSLGSTETATVGAGGTAVSSSGASNAGGNSSFGSWVSAYGGGGGFGNSSGNTALGGGGGGQFSAGVNGTNTYSTSGFIDGGGPGRPYIMSYPRWALANSLKPAVQVFNNLGNYAMEGYTGFVSSGAPLIIDSFWHGGGGGFAYDQCGTFSVPGADSVFGGGGGGAIAGGNNISRAGGTSSFGGNGGASANGAATSGTAPGGGGGASKNSTSGAGAAGRIIVTVFDGA